MTASRHKYWYNHEKGALLGFPAHLEHDVYLKKPEHAPKLGISKDEATQWNVGRTKATMFTGKKPPLLVYSQEPYDKEMQEKLFKRNTRINVTSKGMTDHGHSEVNHISVHTHSLKEFPHAQDAVMHILDHHKFDPDETVVHHETVVHGDNDVATSVPARDYVTTNSARKMWSRHAGRLESEVADGLVARILEGDDVDRAIIESASVIFYHFYGVRYPAQKELAR